MTMRRIACEHDKVFSGHLRHGAYAWICRACGCCGWSSEYDISRVNLDEYHSVRVLHGWATPRVIPPPPRVPVIQQPKVEQAEGVSLFSVAMYLFALMLGLIVALGLPIGPEGQPVLQTWEALIGSGVTLGVFTLCYVAKKKGF